MFLHRYETVGDDFIKVIWPTLSYLGWQLTLMQLTTLNKWSHGLYH